MHVFQPGTLFTRKHRSGYLLCKVTKTTPHVIYFEVVKCLVASGTEHPPTGGQMQHHHVTREMLPGGSIELYD